MAEPTGTVTFLFTDIEGSTRMWESAPEAMRMALERHDRILRSAIEENGGFVFATGGDGFSAAFSRAGDALTASSLAQAELRAVSWPEGAAIRVRMGLHTGEAWERDGDYFGPTVNRVARLTAVANGAQVICTQSTAALADGEVSIRSLGQHRLRDLAAAAEVFQVGEGTFPPLRSVDAVPTNLPTMRAELIGRSDDVTALVDLVRRERLVTLTGVGGVGKTRLALGVAASVTAEFADGCWLVELAAAGSGDDVVNVVASAVRAPTTDAEGLESYLEDRRMLIVLDNCEHVLDGAADLVDQLLVKSPEVAILATSREPLGLDGEQVRRVQSLSLPNAEADLDEVQDAAAVVLFTERARAVAESFGVDATNADAVADICRHLDGIPLAIELAAALTRAMPPMEIAKRLDERFRLLTGGTRRSQERQRTLLATVAWSHELLDDREKEIFRQLAVFPASFDLAAAEAVAGGQGDDVVECVLRLVDRSLVVYEPDRGRYRLLETLRQYGADRLADADETDTTAERHARHYLGLIERLVQDPDDANRPDVPEAMGVELDNLRSTAEWCIESGSWAELAELCHRLKYFLQQYTPVDAAAWYETLIEHASDLDDQVVVDTLGKGAYLQVMIFGNFEAGADLSARSRELAATKHLQESDLAWAAVAQAGIFTGAAPTRVLADTEHALAVAEARRSETMALVALNMMSSALLSSGEAVRSAEIMTATLDRAGRRGWPLQIAPAVVTASSLHLWNNTEPDFAMAFEILDGHPVEVPSSGIMSLWLDVAWGTTLLGLDRPDAVAYLVRAARLADRLNSAPGLDLALRALAVAAVEGGLRAQGIALLTYSEAHFEGYRIQPGVTWMEERMNRALGDFRASVSRQVLRRSELMELIGEIEASFRHTPSQRPTGAPPTR